MFRSQMQNQHNTEDDMLTMADNNNPQKTRSSPRFEFSLNTLSTRSQSSDSSAQEGLRSTTKFTECSSVQVHVSTIEVSKSPKLT